MLVAMFAKSAVSATALNFICGAVRLQDQLTETAVLIQLNKTVFTATETPVVVTDTHTACVIPRNGMST